MSKTRCSYCVEGGQFKFMIGQGGGDWFICARCGHLTMPSNPRFKCTCAHCVKLELVRLDVKDQKGRRGNPLIARKGRKR